MPQVVPFLIKVGTLVTFGAATGTAAAVIGGIAVVGTFAASRFLKPKLNMNIDDNAGTRSATVRSTTEAQKRVYGETLVSGPITYAQVSGTNNRYLHQVIALAGHELTAIDEIRFDEHVLDLTNSSIYNPNNYRIISGKFGPQENEDGVSETVVYIETRLGAASQTAYGGLRSDTFTAQEYLATHRGDGIASVYVRLTTHEGAAELWDDVGNPRNIRALVRGAKIYDPRLEVDAGGTAGASPTNASYVVYDDNSLGVGTSVNQYARDKQGQNPALIIADLLMNDDFGLGVSASKIDWASVITAADKCDQLVAIPSSAVQKRFFASGVVFGSDSHRRSIEKILMAMDGDLLYSQGKYIIKAGVYEAPTETFTESDIVSAVQVKTATPRQDRYNQISGLFIDPNENFKLMEFGPITVDGAYARDNGEILPEEIKLPFTSNRYAAQRIAWKKVNQSFAQTMLQVTVNLKGMRVRVGDRINITLTDFESIDSGNWSPKIFKVISWGFAEDGSGVDLTLIEDASSFYDDPDEDDYSTINAQGTITTTLPDVPSPSSFVATSQINSIRLDWVNPANNAAWEQIWIFRNTTGTTPTDNDDPITKLRTTSFIDQRDADGTEYYYWIQAVKYPTGTTPSSGSANKQKSPMIALSTPSSGKIAATKIGQTVMDEDSVGSTQIIDGNVGSDQIATTIQSNNWSSSGGTAGWQINKTGAASFQTATIKGTITASDGTIGGTTIESDKLYQYSGSGSESHGDADTDFYLDDSGNFSLKDKFVWTGGSTNTLVIDGSGTFSGSLSSADGTFTGALSGGTISIGTGNNIFKADTNGIYLGNATFGSAPFRVTPAGVVTATSATVTGSITATSGSIANSVTIGGTAASTVKDGAAAGATASQVNKGLALLLNQNAAGSSNTGEAALVGLDKDGVPEFDTDGFIVYNGNKITIPHDEVAGYNLTIITAVANKRGFICFDANKTQPFSTASYGDLDVAFVYKEGDQWYYDENSSTGVTFTPSSITGTRNGTDGTTTPELVAIGWLETSTSDVILTGGLFEPIALESAPFAGDELKSGSIGGVSITGTKLYQGTGAFNNTNTGFYLDDTGQFSLKDKLSFDGTDLSVSGEVTASSGTIGGFTLGTQALTAGSGSNAVALHTVKGIYLGATTFNSSPFRVNTAGDLTASSATITGTITADSFTLNSGATLSDPDDQVQNTNNNAFFRYERTSSDNSVAAPSNTEFNNAFGRNPRNRDAVVVVNTTSNPNVSAAYIHNGTSFQAKNDFLTGDIIVDGTIVAANLAADSVTAAKIDVSTLSAIAADLGDITAGTIQSVPSDSSLSAIPSNVFTRSSNQNIPTGTESGAFIDLAAGSFVFGDSDNFISFAENSGGTAYELDIKGVLAPTILDLSGVTDTTVMPSNIKASGYTAQSIGVAALSEAVWNEVASRVGTGSGGFYATASGSYLGEATKYIYLASTPDHGTQSVLLKVAISDVMTAPVQFSYGSTGTQVKVKLWYKPSTDSDWSNEVQAGTTQTFQANPTPLQYATRYTIDASYEVTLTSGTGGDLANGTDYDFRLELEQVNASNVFLEYGSGGANDSSGTPVTFEVSEGTQSISTGGNADTLDNLDSTQFLRSDTSDTLTGNLSIQGDLNLRDTDEIILGDDDDMKLFHSGGGGQLSNSTGNLTIRSSATDGDIYFQGDDGSSGTTTYFYLDGGDENVKFNKPVTISDDLTVTGSLTITGDIDQYNVTDLDVTDKTITVNSGGTQALSDGAGLIVDRGTATNASITWNETSDEFDFTNGIDVTGPITASDNLSAGNSTDISMDGSANGQVEIKGSGYQGAIALDNTAMHIYHNSSSRSLVLGTNETARMTISGTGVFDFHGRTLNNINEATLSAALKLQVSGSDSAHQRVDARDDATEFSRAHWYGVKDNGDTSNFRHAWYDGSNYINVTAASGTITFGGGLAWSGGSSTNANTAYTYSQIGHLPLVGGTLTGGIRFRNNTTGDNVIIEDIDWVTSAAEGTDDRIALVRAQTSGGTSTTRGGKLYLYTRKPNNSGFNSAILGNDGTFTVTNLVSNGGVTANGSTSTFTDVNVGSTSHSAAKIDIIATDTSGSPAMTNTLRMQGHNSRGQGILFENVTYSGEEWFAGLNYGGNFNNYSIGYDASGGQAEYMANALFTVTSSGSLQVSGNDFIDSSRNITATSATASGDIQGETLIAKGGTSTYSTSTVTLENSFDTAHLKSSYTNPSSTTETYLAFHTNKAGDTNGTVSESMRLSGDNLSVNGEVSSDGFAIGTDTIIGSNTRITAGDGTTSKAGVGFLGSGTTGLSYSSSRDRVSILSGGTVRAYIQTPSTNPIADAFYVDGTSSFNGQISVTNHGNSSQWNTAYGWGDHSTAGYLTAEADTLSTVTARGSTSATSIGIVNTTPTITLRDTDSTGNAQVGWISFQDSGSTERAWIGYGSSNDSVFTIRNSLNYILAYGTYFRSEGYIRTPYYLAESSGSAGSPAYSFASDTNTGMYRYGEDDLMFSVGGTDTLQLGSGFITQPRQTFTHPASAAGWYKIAKVDSRGGGRIIISYTGGNFTPNTYIIDYFKNWSTHTELKLNQFGTSGYITNVRIRQDNSDSKFYIEIYLSNSNVAQTTFIYDQRLLGYNSTTTLYTGTLSAGSSSGTTYAEEIFTQSGITTSRMTVADHLGVGVQANASYALYVGGDIAQSSGSITAFGNITAGNGYVKAGTNSGGGFWVGSSQVIDHNGALTVDNINLNIGTNTNGIKVTGSSSNFTDIQIANTGTGDAVLWFDASNGDFVGSDYASIRQTNTLALELGTQSSGGHITFKPADALALTLNTDQTATFEKSIVVKTPNGYSTDGGRLISSYYSGNDVLAVISQDRSSGSLTFGYGAESSRTTTQQFVSTFDNFSGNRSAMQLRNNRLELWGTNGGVQTTVGDQLTTMTNRITLNTDTGNIVTTGAVTLGNNIVFSGIAQNAYHGIIPETDQNLMLGTGSGSEPRIYLKGTGNGQSDAGDVFIGAGTGGVIRLNNVVSIPSTSYFTGNTNYGYRFNDASDSVNLVIIDNSGNFSVLRGTSTIVSDAGTDVVESIRNPSTSWGEYALTRYGTEGADFRYMDFGYYRGTDEATRGLVMRSQAGTVLHHFYDSGEAKFGGDVVAQKANAMFHARSSADSQTVGFRAGYQNHATLQAFFRYTTGDAQLYIDNDFNGNNGLYSNINFRNKANNGTSLINRMTIHGSTGHVNITGGDLQMQGTSLVDSSRNVTANTVTAQGASGGFFYAEDTTINTATDELIGGFLFKSNDDSGTEPHYAGMTARTTNIYGVMALEFFADRSDYENDTPAMRLYSDSTDASTNTLSLDSVTKLIGASSISSGAITSSGRSTFDAVTITDDGQGSPTLLIQTDDDNPWAFQIQNDSATDGGLFQSYVHNNSDVYFRVTKTNSYADWYFQVFDAQTSVTAMRLNEDGIYSSLTADVGAIEIGGTTAIATTRRFYASTGTNAKAAYSFDGESNTGWYKPAAGEIAFIGQGTEHLKIKSTGELEIPDGRINVDNDATSFDALLLGSTTQTAYTNMALYSNSGTAQMWKAGTGYTAWGGASAFNIYNSNGIIALHPSGTSNVLVATSTSVYTGQSLGVGLSAWDTTNLKLEVNGNASIRRGFALYFGVNSTSFNTWQTRLRNSGSTAIIDGQALQHTDAGYGTSTFFTSDSSGMNIQTGDLLMNGTAIIKSDGNAFFASSYRLNDNYIERRLNTPYFTNGTSNLAVDITLGNVSQNTVLEILVTGGYSFANTTGLIRRRWNFGANPNNSIWQSPTIIDETIEGPIVNHLFVSDPFWDSSASTYKIRIYKKDSAGNSYNCLIRNFSVNAADDLESNLSMGSLLTSTSTTSSHSAGTNAASGYRVAGNAFVDSSRNVTVGNNIYFGGASNQSTIAGGTHLYYYADGENKFYTYDGSWQERARITDSGMNVYGDLTASGAVTFTSTLTVSNGITSLNDLNLRRNNNGDGSIIRDLNWLNSFAEGTDDRLALIRVQNQGGGADTRGGKMVFYTRQSGSSGFNTAMQIDNQGYIGMSESPASSARLRVSGGIATTSGNISSFGDTVANGKVQAGSASYTLGYWVGSNQVIDGNRNLTNIVNATIGGQLNVASGAYEGSIVFGTSDAWHSGIRQHDDGDAELRIWHKHSTRGRIHIATAYDGEPSSLTRPTTGIIVYGSEGDVGIGNFSSTTPTEKLHVLGGNIIAEAGTPKIAAVSTNNATNASLRATISTTDGYGMYFDYHPNSAVGFIDNTYPRTGGYVYGDIEFRQSDDGSMVTRAKFDNNSRKFRVYQDVSIGSATQTTAQLVIEAENTDGAPATTTSILMKGYESRAQGTFFENVSYSGKEWFAGMQYGGSHQMYQIGYDASGGQSEYGANRIAGFYSDGSWYHGADVLVDSSRNIKPASVDNGYGTSIKPSYSFDGDSNTGFYRSAADEMTFLNGGSSSLVLRSDQSVRASSYFRSEESISVDNEAVVHAAHFSAAGSSQSGAILIQLPGNRSTNWSMAVFRVTTYEYSSDAHNIYYVSGHDWTSGWYNNGCTHHGLNAESVKLINNTTTNKQAILIGATSTSRSYLHVSVDIIAAPSFYTSNMDWQGNWSVTLTTSLSGWDHASQSNICRTALVSNAGNRDFDIGSSGGLYFGGNSYLVYNGAEEIRHQNSYGTIRFGPLNTTGAHIYTDRDRFYFNEKISLIDGQLTSYSGDLVLLREEDSSHKLTLSTTGITATGNVTAYSDERLKENIETLDGSKVYDMRGVSFTKDGHDGSGVIAQELEKVAPELVQDGEYKSVAYGNLVGYLIEAVKDQKALIDNLTQRIEELENGNNTND